MFMKETISIIVVISDLLAAEAGDLRSNDFAYPLVKHCQYCR